MSSFNPLESNAWRSLIIRFALVVVSVAIIVWIMPRDNGSNFKIEQGKPWHYGELTAPFDFPVYKDEATVKKERDSLMRLYEPYYNFNNATETQQIRQFTKDYAEGIPGLSYDYINIIANRLQRLYKQGIMENDDFTKLHKDTSRIIRVVSGKNAVSVSINEVLSTVTAYEQLFLDPTLASHSELLQKCNLNDYITANLTFDKERNELSQQDLTNSVPLASGVVQRGQKIIGNGEIVNGKTANILESFIKENNRRKQDNAKLSVTILGQIIYVAILLFCFTIYLSLFRNQYFERARSTAMLYALIIFFSVLASIMVDHTVLHLYILPLTMVPIFIRVFMDSGTAFMAHVTMVLICACMLQHPLEFIVLEVVSGLVAIFSLRELSSRSQLFKTAIFVTLAAVTTNLALHWIRSSEISRIDYSEYNFLMVNGLLLFCSYPLLYILEKTFGFTSNITLIELSDMNKDLLRRMSEVAPGTFQHSIQVGNLAAEIANKIGAKSQLVRTGALYHDIGKIQNPVYFTENQSGVNPHEMLSYVESAQMLISHVTEGVKLADKYNLPQTIKEFIQTHHGLGKTKYFYIKQKNEHPDEFIDDLLFTYPGPNPFTKEQAILMMADTVEAASRSLPDYTEQSIRELVNRLIDSQVAEGYFRECPITFRDIQYAKTVLIEKLKTIYHTRISYPEINKSAESPSAETKH